MRNPNLVTFGLHDVTFEQLGKDLWSWAYILLILYTCTNLV